MINKRSANEEVFRVGDKAVRLVADFGFLTAVNSHGHEVSKAYVDLSSGDISPIVVRDVLACAMVDIDDCQAFAESIIEEYGLQECAIMAQIMLSHAMIGDAKKRSIAKREAMASVLDQMIPSQSTSLRKAGLLWAACFVISTAAACMTTSALSLLIA